MFTCLLESPLSPVGDSVQLSGTGGCSGWLRLIPSLWASSDMSLGYGTAQEYHQAMASSDKCPDDETAQECYQATATS